MAHDHDLNCLHDVGGKLVCVHESAPAPKRKVKSPLTERALEGWNSAAGSKNPYLATSPSAYAWAVGEHFRKTGRTAPRDVRMGRGYTIHANDMLFNADTLERIR